MKTVYGNTAILTNTRNNQSVEAEVDDVRENNSLNAFISHIKVHMKWNGKIYVGKMAGMEFTTPGPTQHATKLGRY
jgi:hypothetical protein